MSHVHPKCCGQYTLIWHQAIASLYWLVAGILTWDQKVSVLRPVSWFYWLGQDQSCSMIIFSESHVIVWFSCWCTYCNWIWTVFFSLEYIKLLCSAWRTERRGRESTTCSFVMHLPVMNKQQTGHVANANKAVFDTWKNMRYDNRLEFFWIILLCPSQILPKWSWLGHS